MDEILLRKLDDKKVIDGYASVFNHESKRIIEKGKMFIEVIREGAFDETDFSNTVANINHDDNKLLARNKSNTLQLSIDERGLKYTFEIPDTQLGRDTGIMIERGDYFESSFRFIEDKSKTEWKRIDGQLYKYINRILKVNDISIVTNGAYTSTDISVKELEQVERNITEIENKDKNEDKYSNRKYELAILKIK